MARAQRSGSARFLSGFAASVLVVLACAMMPGVRADELIAEPDGYRTNDYRTPVPATLKGAKVVGSEEAKGLLAAHALFVDVYPRPPKPPNLPAGTVWRDPAHESIEGAVWLPNVGYGVLAPPVDEYFRKHLAALTGGDKGKPLVFFCLKNCWMSWNAAKRALEMGYANVVWFPDGTDGWRELGLPITNVQPLP